MKKMEQPRLSIDITRSLKCPNRIESDLKEYFRVWASQDTKNVFIRPERLEAFNHIVKWSIGCRNMNSEISYAFKRLAEQLARGVTDTKKQSEVKWYTMPDVIMQYYCNDIAYRIRSAWDKLSARAEIVTFFPWNFDTLNPSNSSGNCGYPLLRARKASWLNCMFIKVV